MVIATLGSLRDTGYTPSVIAVNSWRVAHELTASYRAGGTGGAAEIDGASVEVEYVGDTALCVVGDLS